MVANVSAAGATVTVGTATVPVPVSVTVCVAGDALSVMTMEPVRVPDAVGLKVVVTTQLAPAARLVPQVLVSL